MSFGYSTGGGPYEVWTVRLREWSKDAGTSLDGLPALTEDSFDQATYLRLVANTQEAIRVFMERWSIDLARVFDHAQTTHSLGVEMVRLRKILGARLTLAGHPGWPQPIRAALLDGLRSDLAALQSDLEEAAGRSGTQARFDRARNDEMVALIRRNPLTSLLHEQPPPPTSIAASPTSLPTARTPRRIIF